MSGEFWNEDEMVLVLRVVTENEEGMVLFLRG